MRKKLALGFGVVIVGCLAGGWFVIREAQAEVPLTVLQDATLRSAYQQDWAWNHIRTRERKRMYASDLPFESALASVRKELLAAGWTEHRIKSSSPIYVFREKVGGYHISVAPEFRERGVLITVSEPQRPATPYLKLVSAVQGFDRRYLTR